MEAEDAASGGYGIGLQWHFSTPIASFASFGARGAGEKGRLQMRLVGFTVKPFLPAYGELMTASQITPSKMIRGIAAQNMIDRTNRHPVTSRHASSSVRNHHCHPATGKPHG